MSVLFYRRPDYVERAHEGPLNWEDCQKYVERTKGSRHNIPPELSFENVVNNKALPPCSLQDFMDYLKFVARDAENLQFYLWLKDYTERFNALKNAEKSLSPEWKPTDEEKKIEDQATRRSNKILSGEVKDVNFDNLNDLEKGNHDSINLKELKRAQSAAGFSEPPGSPIATASDYESFISRSIRSQKSVQEIHEDANAAVGLKWQGFSIQPFRDEVGRIVAHYIAPGAPRELNLSHRDRTAVLHAVQHTTHPSAFAQIQEMVENNLRGRLHPNFVRWSICNGNKPKVFFVRVMGVSHTAAGILLDLILTLSKASRWYRILGVPLLLIGLVTLIAAYKGLCVILHASGKVRNMKPWEDEDSLTMYSDTQSSFKKFRDDEEATLAPSDAASISKTSRNGDNASTLKRPRSLDTFGSSNSVEDQPWYDSYQKKPVLQKVFENNTWVMEESIRLIQDKIILQSQVWGVSLTILITIIFTALPKGNLF